MKKVLFLTMICLMTLTMQAQSYVDLGLPSGTKWKSQNEKDFYTFDEANSQFGSRIPSKKQWEELKSECQWAWTGNGYKITGTNGNSIVLPITGYRFCNGSIILVDSYGGYWSSTLDGSDYVWSLGFSSSGVNMNHYVHCVGFYVRLVQD